MGNLWWGSNPTKEALFTYQLDTKKEKQAILKERRLNNVPNVSSGREVLLNKNANIKKT
jgi:hypothetical protein